MGAPVLLEHFRSNFEEGRRAIAAGILNGHLQRTQRFSARDKTRHVASVSNIANLDMRSPSDGGDTLCGLAQLVLISPGDDYVEAGLGERAPRGSTEPARRSNTQNQHTAKLHVRHGLSSCRK